VPVFNQVLHPSPVPEDHLLTVQAVAEDRPRLLADISGLVTGLRGNIVHVEHRQTRGMLTMLMFIEDPEDREGERERLEQMGEVLKTRLEGLGVDATADVSEVEADPPARDLRVMTIIGADKLGVMHAITRTIADHEVPILQTHQVASGEFMAFELVVDVGGNGSPPADLDALREDVRSTCEAIGVDVVVQPHGVDRQRRRLVVFDMDSTLIQGEVINELARAADAEEEVEELTERAMAGELDFEEALRARVSQLEGLDVEQLESVAEAMELTPGASDLVRVLKQMGFTVALISGGFTFFTDRLRDQLGLDYAFGNELVIEEGALTGEVRGEIIDSQRKGELVEEIAEAEGLPLDEVVAIGDGANDQIMLQNAGLGIAFNAEEILRRTADGQITRDNLAGLLYCLGASDLELDEFRRASPEATGGE
jgi:phosphoserine phosphatase